MRAKTAYEDFVPASIFTIKKQSQIYDVEINSKDEMSAQLLGKARIPCILQMYELNIMRVGILIREVGVILHLLVIFLLYFFLKVYRLE